MSCDDDIRIKTVRIILGIIADKIYERNNERKYRFYDNNI